MSIVYTWDLNPLQVKIKDGDFTNVVYNIGWRLIGTLDKTSSSVYGAVTVGAPTTGAFTPFEQLTQDQVQGWVESTLGADQVEKLKQTVAQAIDLIRNPTTRTLPPPWQNPARI